MNKLLNLLFGKNESVRHARNYMMGQIINKGLGFLLMPITTKLLTQADYGTNSIFTSLVNIFVIIMPLCLYRGVTRFHYDQKYDEKKMLGTQFAMMMITMTLLSGFMLLTLRLWNDITGLTMYLTMLVMLHSYFQSIINFHLAYMQARKQSSKYAFLNVLVALFTTLGGIYLMMGMQTDRFMGLVYSNLFFRGLMALYGIYDMRKDLHFTKNNEMMAEVWRFNLPLIPHMISSVILNSIDRFMIDSMIGKSAAGLYSFAYNFGFLVNIVVYAINQTWGPEFYDLMNKKDYKTISSRIWNYQNALLSITTLLVFFAREATLIMADPKFHPGVTIIPMIAYGYVFFHLYSTISNYSSYYKKTAFLAIVSGVAAVFNIITNYYGIKYFGYEAAAFTTVLSYLVQYIAYYYANKCILKLPMHNTSYFLIKTLLFCIGTQVAIAITQTNINNLFLSIAIKSILTLLTLALIWKGNDKHAFHS